MFQNSICVYILTVCALVQCTVAFTEDRAVSGFRGVRSSGAFDITVDMSTGRENVKLEVSQPNILNHVETVVRNGVLDIHFRGHVQLFVGPVKVYVNAVTINSVDVTGACSINVLQPLSAPSVQLTSSGSSGIRTSVVTGSLSIQAMGSTVLDVSGTSSFSRISTQGSALVNAGNLQSNSAQVYVEGSGEVTVDVISDLTGSVLGSGSLFYRGQPRVNVRQMGSSNVQQI